MKGQRILSPQRNLCTRLGKSMYRCLAFLLFIIFNLAAAEANEASNSTSTSTSPSLTTTPSFSPSPTYLASNGTGAPSITANSRVPESPSYTSRPSARTSGTRPPQASPATVSDTPTSLCSIPDCGNSSFPPSEVPDNSPSSTTAIVQTPSRAPTKTDSVFSPPSMAPNNATDGDKNQIKNNYGASCELMLADHPECKAMFNVCSGSFNSCAAEGFVDGCAVQNCQAHGSSAAGESSAPNRKENNAANDTSSHYDPVTSRATMVPVRCLCYVVALFFGMHL